MMPSLEISLLAISGNLIQENGQTVDGNVANVRRSVLNGKSADVPEDIAADWSSCVSRGLQRLTAVHPKAMFSVDDTVMHCRTRIRVFRSARYKIVPSPSWTTTTSFMTTPM